MHHVLFGKFSQIESQFCRHKKEAGQLGDISQDSSQNMLPPKVFAMIRQRSLTLQGVLSSKGYLPSNRDLIAERKGL